MSEVEKTVSAAANIISNVQGKIVSEGDRRNKSAASQSSPNGSQASADSAVPEEPQPSPNGTLASDGHASLKRRTSSSSAQQQPSNNVSNVLLQLEQLIVSDEWTRGKESALSESSAASQQSGGAGSTSQGTTKRRRPVDGPRLSELGRTLVTSYSLKAYIDLLGVNHRQSIASWLYGNTSTQLSSLFRFPNALVHCEDSDSAAVHSVRSGIGHAARLALRHVYGAAEFGRMGWRAFLSQTSDQIENAGGDGEADNNNTTTDGQQQQQSNTTHTDNATTDQPRRPSGDDGGCSKAFGPPVVYISPGLHMDVGAYLANEFAIADCLTVRRCEGMLAEVEGRLNHALFEQQLRDDCAMGRRPLLVVAVVGSAIFGQNDLVSKLIDLRKQYGFWLHVIGQGLAALATREPSDTLVKVLSQVDSMTLPLAQWLGIPAAPVVTLHRPVEDFKPTYREKLDTLPWWVATQHLTTKRMTEIVENAYFLSKIMLKGLSNFSRVEIFGISNPVDFAGKVYKGQFSAPTVLIFKYRYHELYGDEGGEGGGQQHQLTIDPEDMEYADSLNSWLGQGLISECRQLGLHLIELGGVHGTAFRFCPLESAAAAGTKPDHVQQFVKQLGETLAIVDATVRARKRLQDVLDAHSPNLCRVPIQKWAGVGAVCYIPTIVRDTSPTEWNDQQRQQVSYLNLELVHSLRATDSAFSSGDSALGGVSCVKFGMLADDKDLDDLIAMVAERGKTIEQSAQYLESLAELIRQGIEAANEDLKKENNNRLEQEGVIRQLPIMGSIWNWFSPVDKETTNIKGRSFDLKTGKIYSTDVLYKHRLQLEGEGQHLATTPKAPIETPMVPHSTPAVQGDDDDDNEEETTVDDEQEDPRQPVRNGPVEAK